MRSSYHITYVNNDQKLVLCSCITQIEHLKVEDLFGVAQTLHCPILSLWLCRKQLVAVRKASLSTQGFWATKFHQTEIALLI